MKVVLVLGVVAGCSSSPSPLVVVATGLTGPSAIAQDAHALYVIEDGTMTMPATGLVRIDKTSGETTQLSTTFVLAVAADDAGAVWIESGPKIQVLPAGASAPTTLVPKFAIGDGSQIRSVALDATAFYVFDAQGQVVKAARDGSTARQMGVGASGMVVADPNGDGVWGGSMYGVTHYFADPQTAPIETTTSLVGPPFEFQITTDGSVLLPNDGGGLVRYKQMGNTDTLASLGKVVRPSHLALDGDVLYFFDDEVDQLDSIPADAPDFGASHGVDPTHIRAKLGPDVIAAIAVDDTRVYWADAAKGAIDALPR